MEEKSSDLFNGSVKTSGQGWGGAEAWVFVLGSPPQAFPGPLPGGKLSMVFKIFSGENAHPGLGESSKYPSIPGVSKI